MAYALQPRNSQVQVASGLDIIAGLWLFISTWVVTATLGLAWSNAICGALVVIFAASRTFGAYRQPWLSWLNVLLGIWAIISPWVVSGRPSVAAIWSNVITGIVIIILAGWSALASGTPETIR